MTDEAREKQIREANRLRLGGLRRFAAAITILNIIGHFYLGFEQSFAQPVFAVLTAYGIEICLEMIAARSQNRPYKFSGGLKNQIDFLLPAHITALAVSMLLYANSRLLVVCFAAAVAIVSKHLLQAPVGKGKRHFYNPSNFGISVVLILFPWVGISQPYMFTENLDGWGDWILPAIIVVSGTLLNALFTKRLPLIAAWLGGFAAQAVIRHLFFDASLTAALLPMTGVTFILYTFYMVTDPATTPLKTRNQIVFGLFNAFLYGLLMISHIVFGLFFALTITCTVRGLILYAKAWSASRAAVGEREEVRHAKVAPAS